MFGAAQWGSLGDDDTLLLHGFSAEMYVYLYGEWDLGGVTLLCPNLGVFFSTKMKGWLLR
jgi:hypothetical protein